MHVEKMHGCGNDFCVLEYAPNIDYSKLAIKLCDRKTGIGSDGMIVVKKEPELEMLFYNMDGSRAPMCGNGIRCFSKYAYDHGMVRRNKLDVLTGAGRLTIEIESADPFKCIVDMGAPIFNNRMINVNDPLDSFGRVLKLSNDKEVTIYSFFMGTVHTVIFVDSFEADILNYAEEIEAHKVFAKKTNVNFVKIIDKSHIEVKTFERGVGWTLACGTGCCASVVAANKLGLTYKKVNVKLDYPKYYCVYASRRDAYDYLYSKGDILGKYSNYICMSGRMSEALSGAMGNDFFIAKFETLDEVTAFKSMVLVKK